MTSTLTITLPDQLRAIVDRAVTSGTYMDADEFVRDAIRQKTDSLKFQNDFEAQAILEKLLLEGMDEGKEYEDNEQFWQALNAEADGLVHQQKKLMLQD